MGICPAESWNAWGLSGAIRKMESRLRMNDRLLGGHFEWWLLGYPKMTYFLFFNYNFSLLLKSSKIIHFMVTKITILSIMF
jgi:hypothetical protein